MNVRELIQLFEKKAKFAAQTKKKDPLHPKVVIRHIVEKVLNHPGRIFFLYDEDRCDPTKEDIWRFEDLLDDIPKDFYSNYFTITNFD